MYVAVGVTISWGGGGGYVYGWLFFKQRGFENFLDAVMVSIYAERNFTTR